jgi:hypothetical protein
MEMPPDKLLTFNWLVFEREADIPELISQADPRNDGTAAR